MNLSLLKKRIQAGNYTDDLYSDVELSIFRRLIFMRWMLLNQQERIFG